MMDCVLCKLAALIVWGGFSLCRDHMERVAMARKECDYQKTALDIVEKLRVDPNFDFSLWAN